jgi:hypothetical protein
MVLLKKKPTVKQRRESAFFSCKKGIQTNVYHMVGTRKGSCQIDEFTIVNSRIFVDMMRDTAHYVVVSVLET